MRNHLWIVGSHHGLDEPVDVALDCHRRLRGPYTGLGTLLRAVIPDMLAQQPELVHKHIIAILSAAPELKELTGAGPETLTSLAAPNERTRIYPANRTRRLAHSALELLDAYAQRAGSDRWTLLFHNAHEADHTDQEFLSIALRRARTGRLRIVVGTEGEQVTEELRAALDQYADRLDLPARTYLPEHRDTETLLRAYLDSDGTSTNPVEIAAYQAADPGVRAAMHTARAVHLEGLGEPSLRMGAIAYHHEHGQDPANTGGQALMDAADYGAAMGFYHAILDLGRRGRELVDPATQMQLYWLLSTKASTALSMLGRSSESEPVYQELRSRYTDPILHMYTDYALGMIYTRFHQGERKDHQVARSYLNNAIMIAEGLPNPEERAFHSVFMQNGRALIDMHLHDLPEALRTVDAGIQRLNRELPARKHSLHQSVLVHNRGRVHGALGQLDKALADFNTVIELDPQYPDYYLDRADVRRQLGDLLGAVADCDHATTLTAPFYELHYNRADLLVQLGETDRAIADFSYVVELEPDQLDARVNLIGLLLEEGRLEHARAHVDAGLLLHQGDARLTHARGLLALEDDDQDLAMAEFDRALAADPLLVPALVSRSTLAYEHGDYPAAIDDLTAAVEVDKDNPDLLYNRGFVHEQARHWAEAIGDYSLALRAQGADRAELLQRRSRCHAELGAVAERDADLAAAALSPGEVAVAG